jgi:hypothetical protein
MNPLKGKRVFRAGGGWVKRISGGILGPFKTQKEAANAYGIPESVKKKESRTKDRKKKDAGIKKKDKEKKKDGKTRLDSETVDAVLTDVLTSEKA